MYVLTHISAAGAVATHPCNKDCLGYTGPYYGSHVSLLHVIVSRLNPNRVPGFGFRVLGFRVPYLENLNFCHRVPLGK